MLQLFRGLTSPASGLLRRRPYLPILVKLLLLFFFFFFAKNVCFDLLCACHVLPVDICGLPPEPAEAPFFAVVLSAVRKNR